MWIKSCLWTFDMSLMMSWYLLLAVTWLACSKLRRFLRIFLFFCSRGSWLSSSTAWLLFRPSGVWASWTARRSTILVCSDSFMTKSNKKCTTCEPIARYMEMAKKESKYHLSDSSRGLKNLRQSLSRLNSNHIYNKLLCPATHTGDTNTHDVSIQTRQHKIETAFHSRDESFHRNTLNIDLPTPDIVHWYLCPSFLSVAVSCLPVCSSKYIKSYWTDLDLNTTTTLRWNMPIATQNNPTVTVYLPLKYSKCIRSLGEGHLSTAAW